LHHGGRLDDDHAIDEAESSKDWSRGHAGRFSPIRPGSPGWRTRC